VRPAFRFILAVLSALVVAHGAGECLRGQSVTSDPLYVNWRNYYIAADGNNYHMMPNIHDMAWKAVPILRAFVYDYELTRDISRIAAVIDRLEYMYSHRLPNYQGDLGWVEAGYGPPADGTEHPSDSARILRCFLHLADVVLRDPQLSGYEPYANKYIALGAEHYDRFRPYFSEVDPAQGSGSVQRWPTYNPPGSRPGETMGNNKEADYARFLLRMYDLTGQQKYLDDAMAIGEWFKSQCRLDVGADAYWWHYWDPAGSWDAGPYAGWAHWTWTDHKGGYSSLCASMVARLFNRGVVYSTEDMQRYVNSQLLLAWQGDHDPPTFWLNDGTMPDYSRGFYGSLCPALIRYTGMTPAGYPTLDSLMQEIWDADGRGNRWSDLGRAPTYLMWQYGSVIPGGPAAVSWTGQVNHGPAGEVSTALDAGGVYSRIGGLRRVQVTFASPLSGYVEQAAALSIVGQVNGNQSSRISGHWLNAARTVLTVQLSSDLPDGDIYTVSLASQVRNLAEQRASGVTSLELKVLAGDVDGSGRVTAADMRAVRMQAGRPVDATTARFDVDRSGAISTADMLAVRNRVGAALP